MSTDSDYPAYLESKTFQDIYGENLSTQTADAILRLSEQSIRKKPSVIRLFDFGCAHARYFKLVEYLEKKFPETKIEYIGFDPFPQAFGDLAKNLQSQGFARQDEDFIPAEGLKEYGTFQKGNRSIRLIHANNKIDFDLAKLKEKVGKVDLSFVLLGTLGHIETRERRVETLKVLGEMTDGVVLGEVPRRGKAFCEEVERYKAKRGNHEEVGSAVNDGDFYYERTLPNGQDIKLFCHAYTPEELTGELSDAGLSIGLTTVDSVELTKPKKIFKGQEVKKDFQVDPNREKRTDFFFLASHPKVRGESLMVPLGKLSKSIR